MADTELFQFYEGTDPKKFTPLTGRNLNRAPLFLKSMMDKGSDTDLTLAIDAVRDMLYEVTSVDELEMVNREINKIKDKIEKLNELEAIKVIQDTVNRLEADLKGSHRAGSVYNYGA